MTIDTGIESEQDFDYGDDGNVPPQSYQSPVTLNFENTLIPDTGTFCLPVITTQARLLEMLAVIRVGAIALQYPATGDHNIDIYKAIETLNECGAMSMSCEDVADCVEEAVVINAISQVFQTSNVLQTTIAQVVNDNGFGDPNRVNPTQTTPKTRNAVGALDEPVLEAPQCDLDYIYGGIRYGIVTRMDDNMRSVLENLVVINDIPERYQTFLDTVPVLGDIAEGIVVNLTQILPDLLNLFDAYSSETHLDEIGCDLFSMVCLECRFPTFQEIADYYKNYGIEGLPDVLNVTVQIIVDAVTGSAETAAKVAYFTLQYWQICVWYLQATFNNLTGTQQISRFARIGANNGDNDWILLCDSCTEQYQKWVWDFETQGRGFWALDTLAPVCGEWAGDGWKTTNDTTTNNARLKVIYPLEQDWEIMAYKMEWQVISGAGTAFNRIWRMRPNNGSDAGVVQLGQGTCTNTNAGWVASGNDLTTVVRNFNQMQIDIFGQPMASTVIKLKRVTLVFNRGKGQFNQEPAIQTHARYAHETA